MAPQDAGVASATVTVGQQLGASVGTSLLNTICDGLAIATWTRTSGARSIQVEAFEPVPPAIQPGIDKEKTAVIGFLQLTA